MLGGGLLTIILLVGGFVWCGQMFRRLREDLSTLKTSPDNTERAVVAGLWLVTAVIGMWMVGTMLGMARGLLFVAGVDA